nr:hypothetical protein CFP56_61686 [Quercus suber]
MVSTSFQNALALLSVPSCLPLRRRRSSSSRHSPDDLFLDSMASSSSSFPNNCTSLERLPEPPNDFYWSSSSYNYTVQCFNCFKLAYNIQIFSNMFEGQSSQQFEKCYIIPGREIPKCQCHHRYQQNLEIRVSGCQMRRFSYEPYPSTWLDFKSEYGKVESHHLWLHSMSKEHFRLPKTPGCSIDNKGFHKVELEIETQGLEVEKIGFPVGLKVPIKISEARDEDDGEFFSSLLLPMKLPWMAAVCWCKILCMQWSECTIATWSMEVEIVGFCLLNKQDIKET